MKFRNGFSLVEVIIAISIVGVIGLISSTILSRTYQVNTQSDNLSKLKSNGILAVNAISEAIRSAEVVACYGSSVPKKSIVIRTFDGKYIQYAFVDPIPLSGIPVTQNGYIIKQENLDPSAADVQSLCSVDSALPTNVEITNRDVVSGVSISDGKFTFIEGVTEGKDLVTIKFNVNPSLTSGQTLGSTVFPVQATIQVR